MFTVAFRRTRLVGERSRIHRIYEIGAGRDAVDVRARVLMDDPVGRPKSPPPAGERLPLGVMRPCPIRCWRLAKLAERCTATPTDVLEREERT
ncbi:MAG: hypothetical protein IT208_03395 [Chthonomonadales bacterium]|nr:hypothetical protein [Chthonomonadales bacterium]